MNRSVCAVIVTFNRKDTLIEALNHILRQTTLPEKIFIVDNNSSDGTIDYLKSISDSRIQPIYLDDNVGSAGAISEAMKRGLESGSYDYFWILDDDTFYKPNALSELIEGIESSDFALLGLHGAHIRFGRKHMVSDNIRLQQADYALIDGALIRAEAVKNAGVVDKRFFMMCDDHEYSLRLRKFGYKIGVLKNGADERLYMGGDGKFTRATLWRGYYSARNHVLILKKYFSFPNLMGYVYLQCKLLVAAALFAPDRWTRVVFRLKGIWHGLQGHGGKTLDPGTLTFNVSKSE
jgi:glycosyltransferase involved in cell wall biosynthesis